MERTCKKCGETKPIEEFTKSPSCKYGRTYECIDCNIKYRKDRYQRTKPEPKIKPTKKTCAKCKNELPATEEYFFKKRTKYKLANGSIGYCYSLRWVCKKCHGDIGTLRGRKKRCTELNCTLDNYKETWIKTMVYKKLKFKELENMTKHDRQDVLRKYKTTGKFMTEEQYNEYLYNIRTISSLNHRKYDYGDVKRVTPQMANSMSILHITDARIALIMGIPVKDVPKEIIEVKRTLIKLKRISGLTHSTKLIKTNI